VKYKVTSEAAKNAIPLIVKTRLSHCQQLRDVENYMHDLYMLPADSKVITTIQSMTKEWAESIKTYKEAKDKDEHQTAVTMPAPTWQHGRDASQHYKAQTLGQ
jgi:hypothetical protein